MYSIVQVTEWSRDLHRERGVAYSGWSNDGHSFFVSFLDHEFSLVLRNALSDDGNGTELCVEKRILK